jgi:hypothetical protein
MANTPIKRYRPNTYPDPGLDLDMKTIYDIVYSQQGNQGGVGPQGPAGAAGAAGPQGPQGAAASGSDFGMDFLLMGG